MLLNIGKQKEKVKAEKMHPTLPTVVVCDANRATLIRKQMHLYTCANNSFPDYQLSKKYIQKLYNSCTIFHSLKY